MRAVVTKFPTRTVPDHAYKTAVHTVPSFRAPYRSRGKGIYLSIHPPMPCWLLYFCRAVLVPRCMWFDKRKRFFSGPKSKHSALVRETAHFDPTKTWFGAALHSADCSLHEMWIVFFFIIQSIVQYRSVLRTHSSTSFSCEAAALTEHLPCARGCRSHKAREEVTDMCVGILYSGSSGGGVGGIRRHGSSAQSSWSHTSVALLYGPWVLLTKSSSPVSTRFCRSGKTAHFYTHTHKRVLQ